VTHASGFATRLLLVPDAVRRLRRWRAPATNAATYRVVVEACGESRAWRVSVIAAALPRLHTLSCNNDETTFTATGAKDLLPRSLALHF
jgi:hypothetical protein